MKATIVFEYHWTRTINGKRAVCYSYFGPDEGSFPPSRGWRRVLIGSKWVTAWFHKYTFDSTPLPLP